MFGLFIVGMVFGLVIFMVIFIIFIVLFYYSFNIVFDFFFYNMFMLLFVEEEFVCFFDGEVGVSYSNGNDKFVDEYDFNGDGIVESVEE